MNNSIEKWMNYAEIMVVDDYPVYYHREISDFIISKKVCETHFVDGNGLMAMREVYKFLEIFQPMFFF
jgi:hypothetical protein